MAVVVCLNNLIVHPFTVGHSTPSTVYTRLRQFLKPITDPSNPETISIPFLLVPISRLVKPSQHSLLVDLIWPFRR